MPLKITLDQAESIAFRQAPVLGRASFDTQAAQQVNRGRDKGALCPSLRTGLADFLHPALQSVVNFQEDRQAAARACLKENKPTAEK